MGGEREYNVLVLITYDKQDDERDGYIDYSSRLPGSFYYQRHCRKR